MYISECLTDKTLLKLLMFLPHSHAVAVVLFLVLPEVASHVWKSPSVIQRTIKKLHCDLQNIHTSFLFPSWSDLNWLSCLFTPTLFLHFWPPRTLNISCKNERSSALSQTCSFIQLLPDKAEKLLQLFQKLNWFRWLGDQGISANCWYYMK